MIRMYSRRLLIPFMGVVQVAEMGRARALSPDGSNWAIQYALDKNAPRPTTRLFNAPDAHYAAVATIEHGHLRTPALHPFLDIDEVHTATRQLFDAVNAARLPFAAADRYEYWLLDERDDSPLALLRSGIDESDMAVSPPPPEWLAIPAAQLAIEAPEPPGDTYIPPVNYRVQKLVEERAGAKPRTAWFERPDPATDDFPPCLIREDWDREEDRLLCDLYIRRLAPRLLMMEGLPGTVRHRLEQAARTHVFEVERFFTLYPEVIDRELLTAARVEARMRRAGTH